MGAMKDFGMGVSHLVGEEGDITERVISIASEAQRLARERGVAPDPGREDFARLVGEAEKAHDEGRIEE